MADVSSSIEEMVERTLTTIPLVKLFLAGHLNGYYLAHCCPNYLKRENFEIPGTVSRIQIQTTTLTSFLVELETFCHIRPSDTWTGSPPHPNYLKKNGCPSWIPLPPAPESFTDPEAKRVTSYPDSQPADFNSIPGLRSISIPETVWGHTRLFISQR
jgi:hypothetical protein